MVDQINDQTTEISPGIDINPNRLSGEPCIKGTRVSVYAILEWLEAGKSFTEIMENFNITKQDMLNTISYTRRIITGEIPLGYSTR